MGKLKDQKAPELEGMGFVSDEGRLKDIKERVETQMKLLIAGFFDLDKILEILQVETMDPGLKKELENLEKVTRRKLFSLRRNT